MIEIKNKVDCCGCGACVQSCPRRCISLIVDEQGFQYARVDSSRCVECGLCEKSCPVLNQQEPLLPFKKIASKNTSEEQRKNSSSGGIFILLATEVIKRGGVVFGVSFDNNWMTCHTYAEDLEGLMQFMGSKYVQSRTENTFKQAKIFLQQGRTVLYSGTPCQIAGLNLYLGKDYSNLLTVEIMCHGVPSPGIWRDYLASLQQCNSVNVSSSSHGLEKIPQIEEIAFRDKRRGWSQFGLFIRFSSPESLHNRVVDEYHWDNVYMQGFLRNFYLRPSCFKCPSKDGKSRADIALGDFWSLNAYHPAFNDDRGVTLVYICSEKGLSFFSHLKTDSIELDPTIRYNTAYEMSAKEFFPQEKFWEKYRERGITCITPLFNSIKPSYFQKKLQSIRYKVSLILKKKSK